MNYNDVRNINTESLKRNELSGSQLGFAEINHTLVDLKKNLLFFEGTQDALTQFQKEVLSGVGAAFVQFCGDIKRFSLGPSESLETALSRKNELLNKVRQLDNSFTTQLLPVLLNIKINGDESQQQLALLNTKISTIDQTLQQKVGQYDNELRNKVAAAEATIKEANNLILEARSFSVEKLTDKYGPIFENQAKKNWIAAMISLAVLTLAFAATIYLAFYLFMPLINQLRDFNDGEHLGFVISNIVFRLTLLSAAFLFTKESLKNYNVNMHLYNLNKHRQNSLLSFNTFIANATEETTKNQLIKELGKTIYSVGQIGYLTEDRKGVNISQIAELIKAVKP